MRRPVSLGGVTAAVLALVAALPIPARASTGGDQARFLALANQVRASVGSPPLALDAGLSAVAGTWATVMATAGNISHNPSLSVQVQAKWVSLGENVGMGPTVDVVHRALVESPSHYQNMVDPAFSLVGIGVAYGRGMVFVVQDFMQVDLRGTVRPPAAAPVPRAAPPPAPRPAPLPPPPPPRPTTTAAPPPPPALEPLVRAPTHRMLVVMAQLRALDGRWSRARSPGP